MGNQVKAWIDGLTYEVSPNKSYEIRWHGRGGQGTVTAAALLVEAAHLYEGYPGVAAAPTFGAERRGAPVSAGTRIDTRPILRRGQVTRPDIVVILDVAYINALKSTTTGLGGSGAAGIMKNATQSSVFGAALGYASSKATPETDPFIHGMVLYSAEFPAEKVPEKAEPVDHFTNE